MDKKITQFSLAKVLFIVPFLASISACSTMESMNMGDMVESFRKIYKSDIAFVEPPAKQDLATVKSVVVQSNTSPSHPTFFNFISTMRNASVNKTPYFIRVEQGNTISGQEKDSILFELDIPTPNIATRSYRENRVRCPGDDVIRTCGADEGYHYQVSCREIKASLTVTYQAKQANGSTHIPLRQFSEVEESSICSDQQGSLPSSAEMVARVQKAAGSNLANVFIPGQKERPNDLFVKTLNASKEQIKVFKEWRNLASDGEIDAALKHYLSYLNDQPDSGEILFNIGYLYQAIGDYAQAKNYYEKAGKAGVSNTKRLEKHLTEVETWISQGIYRLIKS